MFAGIEDGFTSRSSICERGVSSREKLEKAETETDYDTMKIPFRRLYEILA
jgi:hypothetical protein